MTLSRLPRAHSCGMVFAASGGLPDSLVGNGCLYTRFIVSGCRLHVYSTHLQSDTSLWKMGAIPGSQRQSRLQQVEQLAHFMDACQSSEDEAGDAVLICGDLNIDARSAVFSFAVEQRHMRSEKYPNESTPHLM